jgi:hypothetical protein
MLLLVGFVGVAIAVVARQPIAELFRRPIETNPPILKLPASSSGLTAREAAAPHLSWADRETQRIIDEHLAALDGFFDDAKKNTPAFAKEALSFGSKWNLFKDYVPFTRGGQHEEFIRGKFERHVFGPDQEC